MQQTEQQMIRITSLQFCSPVEHDRINHQEKACAGYVGLSHVSRSALLPSWKKRCTKAHCGKQWLGNGDPHVHTGLAQSGIRHRRQAHFLLPNQSLTLMLANLPPFMDTPEELKEAPCFSRGK